MAQLTNCPNCDKLFVKNAMRDVCETCYKEELALFDKVYNFIRKRENRTATMEQVVEGTGVPENLIYKFIKTGRLRVGAFPNLGYPCQKCGTLIKEGKICRDCKDELHEQLEQFEREKKFQEELKKLRHITYHTRED